MECPWRFPWSVQRRDMADFMDTTPFTDTSTMLGWLGNFDGFSGRFLGTPAPNG
jgi:hypothetical protein